MIDLCHDDGCDGNDRVAIMLIISDSNYIWLYLILIITDYIWPGTPAASEHCSERAPCPGLAGSPFPFVPDHWHGGDDEDNRDAVDADALTTCMRVGWTSARRGLGGANTGKVEMVIRSGELTWDFHNFDQLSQLRSTFTISINFHNFDQLSQFRSTFTISINFHNPQWWSYLRLLGHSNAC